MPAGCFLEMSIGVSERGGVVFYITVKIQSLRVAKVSVRNCRGRGGPIGHQKTADGVAVVPCPKVVAARLGIAFFAGELVIITNAQVRNYALAAEGIEIRLFFDISQGIGDHISGAQLVAEVV